MTTEEKLKEYIIEKYKSLRNFVNTSGIDIPYTTIDGIFKRGLNNSGISNVIKLCDALNISVDELVKGNIVPISHDPLLDYARLLAKLSKKSRESALNYISYLVEHDGKEIEIEFTKRGDSQ